MRDDTVYLLYNADADTAAGERRATEYEDNEEFVILYGPGDERQYTDIRVKSRTRLRRRGRGRQRVEGVLLRRGPDIRPLLSEREIASLQRAQELCRARLYRGGVGIRGVGEHLAPVDTKLVPQGDMTMTSTQVEETHEGNVDHEHPDRQHDKEKDISGLGKINKEKPGLIDQFQRGPKENFEIKEKVPNKSYAAKVIKDPPTKRRKEVFEIKEKGPSKSKPKAAKESKERPKEEKAKNNKTVLENEYDSSGSKSKSGRKPRPQSTDKSDNTAKAKKDNGKSDTREYDTKLTKMNKGKSDRSSKTGLSTKSENSGKDAKDIKDGRQHKQDKKDKDTKSLKSERYLKPEMLGKDELNSTTTGKRRQSVSPSSKTKGSASMGKSTSSKREKGATGEADDDQTTGKQRGFTPGKGGRASELESIKSPKGKTYSNREGEENSFSDGKSTNTNITKEKKGKGKSTLTTGPTTARTSERSDNMADSSKKRGMLDNTKQLDKSNKKSRTYSAALDYMIKYVLSDPVFIKLGWTLSTDGSTLNNRLVTFKATPANPWRGTAVVKRYPSGELAVDMDTDGSGQVLYPSGHPAIVVQATSRGPRLTIHSDKTERGDPPRLVGVFDWLGNGVVYDQRGERTLAYNQLEGVFDDPRSRAPYRWHWRSYEVLARQRVKELMNYLAGQRKPPEPARGKRTPGAPGKRSLADKEYERILAELPRAAVPKSKTRRYSSSSGFKSVIFKINPEITLRINGQDNITLTFSADMITHRLDLGVKVDPEVMEAIEEVSAAEGVLCVFEALVNRPPSLERLYRGLQTGRPKVSYLG